MDNRRDVEIEGATQVVTPRSDDGSGLGTPRGDPEDHRYAALEEAAAGRERLGSTNATFASTLTAASNATTAALSSAHSSRSSERMASYFHRHQTVEVLPRNSAPQVAWRKERPNSELLRTFTSSDPLNSRLHQRLLEEECDNATPTTNAASPSRPAPRAPGMRRVPSMGTGLTRNSSWRVYLRNLPRALRFRQNTRSTTRYIDPANAASLRMRLRAQREQAARDAHDDFSDDEAAAPSAGIATMAPPGFVRLERQRSNFEDVGRYRDQPPDMESGPSSIDTGSITTPRALSLKGRVVSVNVDGSQDGQNRPGRTSSIFSTDSAQVAGEKKQYKLVHINPDHSSHSDAATVEDDAPVFASNEVKTSQYSWWSFVPVFLYLTFQKTANLYFLLIGIFQMIPDISPTNGVPLQFLPLSIVTIIDALFAAFEDYKRHIADDQANSAITRVFNRELREFEEVQWRDIRVGDFVKIMNHETIPADVLILSVVPAEGTRNGGNSGICYVETKNLDGETNLKLREAPRATRHMFDSEEDAGESLQGYLESELPNGDINRYSGTLYVEEESGLAQSIAKADDLGDVKVGQFRFLSTLLLTHGRWNYQRVAGLVLYTFYKNIVYCVSMFWYCLKPSAYSGTMIYSAFIQQGYNLFFTALPIMAYAVFDRDLPKEKVLEYPVLYHSAVRQRSFFSYGMFWKWIALAVVDSVGVYYVTLMTAYNVMRNGDSAEFTVLQSIGWTVLCVVVNARFCLMVNTWDILEVAALVISTALLYGFQFAIDEITWSSPDYDTYTFPWMFSQWHFWLGQAFAVVAILAKNFLYEGYRRRFNPDYADLVKEEVFLVKGSDVEASTGDDLKNYSPPLCSYLRPELVEMLDYRDRRVQDRIPVRFTAPGRSNLYRGFAFDQPAYIVNWILSSGGSNGPSSTGLGPLRRKGINVDVRQQILNSDDPVIFENERYQPFSGYGSTYPGIRKITTWQQED
ncbi:hypothetical protein ATCC90586_009498 [Pythium insidiosum]|nr:hypothetical protein ATCC90586_009498 [Pythium insidiosum]